MSSFLPSSSLRHPRPAPSSAVASTTSPLAGGVESHPAEGKWWIREYGVGPRASVKLVARGCAEEHRFTSVNFRTASGSAPVAGLNFGGGGGGGALAVAAGPRVGLYGGSSRGGTLDLNRALRAGSAAQKRRRSYEEDDESVDLFGGKGEDPIGKGERGGLDDIAADRNIPTGGLVARCASHRSDGRLVAVGTEGGTVRICDAHSRATLRTFRTSDKQGGGGDRKAIRAVAWLRDGKRVVAGGDDGVVRVWDVGGGGRDGGLGEGGGADLTLRGHGDRVACVAVVSFRPDAERKPKKGKKRSPDGGAARASSALDDPFDSPARGQLVVSGSYDHTVRVWDVEGPAGEDRCLSVMNHGDPVQALLVLPPAAGGKGRPLLISAGGTALKAWNPFNGSCLGTFPTKHAKTITSMCLLDLPPDDAGDLDGNGESGVGRRHILTGGLDGLLRIHSAPPPNVASGSLPFLHGMRLPDPISALAISSDGSRLAIGTTAGTVTVHQRRRSPSDTLARARAEERREPRHGTYSYFTRGAHERPHDPDDYLLTHQKRARLTEHDALLRKFRYGDALDAALARRQPQAVSLRCHLVWNGESLKLGRQDNLQTMCRWLR